MAENTVEARILLRYATYNQWMNSNNVLKIGEAAVCSFPNSHTIDETNIIPENTPPAIGIKIGDGIHTFRGLPWVQAVAADVYNWAKSSTKPTYTANEIEGLQSYIEEHAPGGGGSGGGDVTVASRLYQIVRGTGDNINKYYLQYRDNTDGSQWVVDMAHYIDVDDFVKVSNWIGANDLSEYPDLESKVAEQILIILNGYDYNDTDVAHQFVTSVSQTNGLISVTRMRPSFTDLAGQVNVLQGGTGRTTIPQNEVMVGNGESPITTIPIADEITNNDALVPNYLIKQYVDDAVAGLAGAMHFIGEATVIITNNSIVNPNINGYNFALAEPGDVILSEEKEFVWTGTAWQLLGDESSYAVKGSIRNVDIASDAAISQSKIYNLTEDLNTKVDKIEGKSLSTNDYTTEEKEKLENIQEYAQVNTIEHILLNDTELVPNGEKAINLQIPVLTEEQLYAIEHFEPNIIEHIFVNGTEILPSTINQKARSIGINFTPFTQEEKTKLSTIESGAEANIIESISINGREYTPNTNKQVEITIDQSALNLNVLEGARYPVGNTYADIDITNKKLELSHLAATGNIDHLVQTSGTYIILDCGSSTDVI